MAQKPRAWQRMLSGRRLDLLDPTPVDVEIEDIAHGLAFVARWNGQTKGDFPYSVAEHSILVEEIFARLQPAASPKERLAALLHDAPEYVIGDMISPVKAAVGPGYGALDDRLGWLEVAAAHDSFRSKRPEIAIRESRILAQSRLQLSPSCRTPQRSRNRGS